MFEFDSALYRAYRAFLLQNSLKRGKIMKKSLRLTESAIMLALAFVLSMVKVVDMPFGGSVTAFSMLPIIVEKSDLRYKRRRLRRDYPA